MKIELTYDEYETFNEVFVAGQIYIGLGENNPYDARNKKGYKMKKDQLTVSIIRLIELSMKDKTSFNKLKILKDLNDIAIKNIEEKK